MESGVCRGTDGPEPRNPRQRENKTGILKNPMFYLICAWINSVRYYCRLTPYHHSPIFSPAPASCYFIRIPADHAGPSRYLPCTSHDSWFDSGAIRTSRAYIGKGGWRTHHAVPGDIHNQSGVAKLHISMELQAIAPFLMATVDPRPLSMW